MIMFQIVRICVWSVFDPYQGNYDHNCFYNAMLNGIQSKEKHHNKYIRFVYISVIQMNPQGDKGVHFPLGNLYVYIFYF